jgi:hypothetical protein
MLLFNVLAKIKNIMLNESCRSSTSTINGPDHSSRHEQTRVAVARLHDIPARQRAQKHEQDRFGQMNLSSDRQSPQSGSRE